MGRRLDMGGAPPIYCELLYSVLQDFCSECAGERDRSAHSERRYGIQAVLERNLSGKGKHPLQPREFLLRGILYHNRGKRSAEKEELYLCSRP